MGVKLKTSSRALKISLKAIKVSSLALIKFVNAIKKRGGGGGWMGGLGRILKAGPRLYVANNCLQDALASLLLNVREDEAGESVWISQR